MSAPRLLAQIVITGVTIVGRAFAEAYKQAAMNAAKNPQGARAAAAAGAGGAASGNSSDAITRQTGIALDEAVQILNIPKSATKEEVLKKYEHLFHVNSPAQGGSFYLQGKIFRAKERWELEFGKLEDLKVEQPDSASSNSQQQPPSP
ncbi:mitochondrial import inner membrane translocase subunit TIM16 [Sorochytrium milnesiophthora]